jgi:hypothetical protein
MPLPLLFNQTLLIGCPIHRSFIAIGGNADRPMAGLPVPHLIGAKVGSQDLRLLFRCHPSLAAENPLSHLSLHHLLETTWAR